MDDDLIIIIGGIVVLDVALGLGILSGIIEWFITSIGQGIIDSIIPW